MSEEINEPEFTEEDDAELLQALQLAYCNHGADQMFERALDYAWELRKARLVRGEQSLAE